MQLKNKIEKFKIDFDKKIIDYFDKRIHEEKNQELKELFNHLKEYILAGGKRLRPYILHKINEEFKQEKGIDNILLSFEFLHNSTLINDDIIDEHFTRRNKPTLRAVYEKKEYRGDFAALLSANLLRNAGLELIMQSKLEHEFQRECISAYLDIGEKIDLAQMLDLEYRKRKDISEEKYLAQTDFVAARFIAHMFKLCAPERYKNEFFEIGKKLGIAFQLADDLMDVDPKKQKGRTLGSDIKEGTPTLLSIYTFQKLGNKDKEKFKNVFGKKDITENELQWIISQYKKTNAITHSKEIIKENIASANDLLYYTAISKNHWIFQFEKYILKRRN